MILSGSMERVHAADEAPAPTCPFAPIPTTSGPMKFDPNDNWTYDGTPMRVLWEKNYRDAAHSLIFGYVERAIEQAKTGRAMEDAYLTRVRGDVARERAERVTV